jgi:prophage maintenance system killer protein
MNGYRLVVSADVAETFLIEQVIVGRKDVETIESWLAQYMRPT